MPSIDELLGTIPVGQIAGRLGVDDATAQGAVQQALPGLLAGLQNNVATGAHGGADGLLGALEAHSGGLLDGGVNLDDVDEADGSKIVAKAFGGQTDDVAAHLAGAGGGSSDVLKKVLPLLAPIVMAFLAKKALPGPSASGDSVVAEQGGGGGIGDLLGGLLGGDGGGGGLGGLLGGGGGAGGLGGLLGGLFGGKG